MDEESDANCSKDAVVYALHAKVHQRKKRVKELVYMNNRYISQSQILIFCASDEPDSPDALTFLDALIRASIPFPSSDLAFISLISSVSEPYIDVRLENIKGNRAKFRAPYTQPFSQPTQ